MRMPSTTTTTTTEVSKYGLSEVVVEVGLDAVDMVLVLWSRNNNHY